MVRIAVCFLVDDRGRVLLQERDSGAPRSPDRWGMVGGHVEEGESFEEAVYREVEEEAGLVLEPGSLPLWLEDQFSYSSDGATFHFQVFAGPTAFTDADVTVGEGRQIVFVDPESAFDLPLSESLAHFLPRFLTSDVYRALAPRRP